MWLSALFSWLHLIALVLGLGSLFYRGRCLKSLNDERALRALLTADGIWGIAALLWIASGLARLLWFEKGAAFYMHNISFHIKLTLFLFVFALELWPMVTFMKWRKQVKRGAQPDTRMARKFWHINHLEMLLVVVIMFVASLMARGVGSFPAH